MQKGTLRRLTICGKKKQQWLTGLDAMSGGTPDPDAPILDSAGNVRTMLVYTPASGVIPCSSGILVLREDAEEASAIELLERTGWAERAERDHYLILLPDPAPTGWNTTSDPDGPDDVDYLTKLLQSGPPQFLIGCKVHRTSRYLAGFGAKAASLAAAVAGTHGELLAGLFAEGACRIETGKACSGAPVPAWLVGCEPALVQGFEDAALAGETVCRSFAQADRRTYESAWDQLFFGIRRMATGGFGSLVHKKTETEMGLIPHLNDRSLDDGTGLAHDWYEAVPPAAEGKLPLLFVLHGGATSAKYCAEQTLWHELGQKYGFLVVYPQACVNSVWNPGLDTRLPSDEAYLLALYRDLLRRYPIDTARVYCTGFSMGGLMTHVMGMLHPEIFAAIAPFSGLLFDEYWKGEQDGLPYLLPERLKDRTEPMPLIQFHGTQDGTWRGGELSRLQDYWARRNRVEAPFSEAKPHKTEGKDGRFHVYSGDDAAGVPMYVFVSVQGLPHGVDLRQPYLAWRYLRGFSRLADGTLVLRGAQAAEQSTGTVLTDWMPD